MPAVTRSFELADGRLLDVSLGGDPDGFPLVLHHGTPGCATAYADWDDTARGRGLRLVCASRPGYASSTRLPGRDVAQAARDTADLLDLLGYDSFVALGASGGGPHALACAALLRDRCLAVATLGGVAPFDADGLDFLAGMGEENHVEFGAALAGEDALRTWMSEHGEPFRNVTAADVAAAFGSIAAPVDQQTLTGEVAETVAADLRRALAESVDGWVDDDLAFTRDWGFDARDVSALVTVWQGGLDRFVPAAHGVWLAAHTPTATLRLLPDEGHISLEARHRTTMLDELLAATTTDR